MASDEPIQNPPDMRSNEDTTPPSSTHSEDVLLYHLNKGASTFHILPGSEDEPATEPAAEPVTRGDIHGGLKLARAKTLEPHELHKSFHSARTDKYRLSVHDLELQALEPSNGITSAEAARRLEKFGLNQLKETITPKWKLFVQQFTEPMPIGLWIAIFVELLIQNYIDGLILFGMQLINGLVGFVEANKAGNAVAALKASLKPVAHVRRDEKWQNIDAALLVPGDCVKLSSGSAVPADCVINEESVTVDQSAITGESIPVRIEKGMQAQMGSTIARGDVKATVVVTGMRTFYGKTAAMLLNQKESLGELQKLMLKVVIILLTVSFVLCGTTLANLLIQNEPFHKSLGFVVVLMVASLPMAMAVVVTATLALGSRELAARKAIVVHLDAIERLAGMDVLCCDKTGTLTQNKMIIQKECPVFSPTTTRAMVLLCAALGTKWKQPPKDALDKMVLIAVDLNECEKYIELEHTPFDASIKRTESKVKEISTGHVFRVSKGAPHVILSLCPNSAVIQDAVDTAVMHLAERGVRTLAVAKTNTNDEFEMLGLLAFLDPPRPDSKDTIMKANSFGIAVKMITGDHQLVAVETAKALQLGNANIIQCINDALPTIATQEGNINVPSTLGRDYAQLIMSKDGFSQALPEHKYVIVEALKQAGHICGMTGDGVNDAPALKVASVGIAVEGATDAARAAASIVLTLPGLNAVVEAIIISRRIFARMYSFLIYRIAATLQLLVFFFFSVQFLHPDQFIAGAPRFWSMPVLALIIITLLNDGTIVSIAYDNVRAPKQPQKWDMTRLWILAVVLGSVACCSSILLLYLALDSNRPGSIYQRIGIPALGYPSVITSIYLKVSLSDYLTIFAARTGDQPCYTSLPGKSLLSAAMFAVLASTSLSLLWPFEDGRPIDIESVVFIWIYCIIWFVIQDTIKVVMCKLCRSIGSTLFAPPDDPSNLHSVLVHPN